MTMTMTIKQQLLLAGMKENEIDNHESDLYVLKNEVSTKFIESYEFKSNVTTFIDEIDNVQWYDFPFAYSEHHNKKYLF